MIHSPKDIAVLLLRVNITQLVYHDRNEYVFEFSYPNFERTVAVVLQFTPWLVNSTLNGAPLRRCIPWYDVVRLYRHCRKLGLLKRKFKESL